MYHTQRIKKTTISFLAFIILLGSTISFAFNCKKASSLSEHLICADSKLKQEDNKLNSVFKTTLHGLDQARKKQLVYEQRDFLAMRDDVIKSCSLSSKNICLDEFYKKRIKQLSSWPNDAPQFLTYTHANQKLAINLFYNRNDENYLAKYELIDQNNKVINKGQFRGCTYSGIIMDIADYLKQKKFILMTSLKNGFAMHFMKGCGAQSIWGLNVITHACVASAPATDRNGNPITIGNDPQKISFAYLEGNGAYRKTTNDYFTLSEKGLLRISQTQPTFQNEVTITCK